MFEAIKFSVTEFFCIYNNIREKALTSNIIYLAFRKTGLHSFNFEKMIAPLHIQQEIIAVTRKTILSLTSSSLISFLAFSSSLSASKYFTSHKVSKINAMHTHL